jgi:hypothetical protein
MFYAYNKSGNKYFVFMLKIPQNLTALILTVLSLYSFGQECERLADGEYLFKYKTKELRGFNFLLVVQGDGYTVVTNNHVNDSGYLEWWPDSCMVKLRSSSPIKVSTDSLDSFQNTLERTYSSYGGDCVEIVKGNMFRMTYCGNLHITKGEGRIIKKRR